jgi:hypothetical protein
MIIGLCKANSNPMVRGEQAPLWNWQMGGSCPAVQWWAVTVFEAVLHTSWDFLPLFTLVKCTIGECAAPSLPLMSPGHSHPLLCTFSPPAPPPLALSLSLGSRCLSVSLWVGGGVSVHVRARAHTHTHTPCPGLDPYCSLLLPLLPPPTSVFPSWPPLSPDACSLPAGFMEVVSEAIDDAIMLQ